MLPGSHLSDRKKHHVQTDMSHSTHHEIYSKSEMQLFSSIFSKSHVVKLMNPLLCGGCSPLSPQELDRGHWSIHKVLAYLPHPWASISPYAIRLDLSSTALDQKDAIMVSSLTYTSLRSYIFFLLKTFVFKQK